MLRGTTFFCAKSGSNAQHGRHAHKCFKLLKHLLLQNRWVDFQKTLVCRYLGHQSVHSNDGPKITMTNLTAVSVLISWRFHGFS